MQSGEKGPHTKPKPRIKRPIEVFSARALQLRADNSQLIVIASAIKASGKKKTVYRVVKSINGRTGCVELIERETNTKKTKAITV